METTPIPEPPGLPFLGNINAINPEFPLGSLLNLADTYGEIYRLRFPHKSLVFLATHALVNEACDEKRFGKRVENALKEIRHGVHDGLFTAHAPQEENWGIAHRVLMPAFGPMSIKDMFPEMHDIASQLTMKWARFGPSSPVMVTDDFTRLTLDTLALCAMDFRFNSFYQEQMHPFIQAMGDFLTESGNRSRRPAFMSMFYRQADDKFFSDIAVLRNTAEEVLEHRKAHPTDQKDLLNAMLKGVDPKTGKKVSDESIIDNLITFLIAGHETTSGLLSFAFYELLKHPEAYHKAQQEVDEVVGTGPIKVEHMSKLPYISAVLRETLRLCSPIPIIGVGAHKDEILGGKYEVKEGESILLLFAKSHLDPEVFGEDAAEFVPERMLDENFDRLNKEFPNCWKPFGNGMRACIGRPFAWQEALLVMAMLLQNFNFVMHDPGYMLQYKQTLTIKPKSFYMRAILRDGLTPTELEHRLAGTVPVAKGAPKIPVSGKTSSAAPPKGKPISIYYGSNSGTCESMAQRLASDASRHGFFAKTVDSLDTAKESLPRDHPVFIVTASYEGQPPDNAAHFVNWIESLKGRELEGVSYAVFGCGHHDWSQTFHRIPKLVDSTLESLGGSRIVPIGLTDAAQGDMFTDFESWEDDVFWPAVLEKYGLSDADEGDTLQTSLAVEVSSPRFSTLRQDVRKALVVETRQLSAPGQPVKKHMEIRLPTDLSYSAGDYLAVLPLNPKENIIRAIRRFQLPWDANLTITTNGPSSLPTNIPVPAYDIFSAYVELAQPATKRNILTLAEAATDEATKTKLKALASPEEYVDEISSKRTSLLDLLEDHPSIDLPLSSFLSMLPPMRVRQYSISSSPLCNPSHLTLTYALLDEPSLSAPGKRRHVGVASSYLSSLEKSDALHVAVRASHSSFHLPNDVEKTPIIMIAAGTGLAPFRGFIQERAALVGAGRKLATAMLFFGCRLPGQDDLYADELAKWEAMGAVIVKRAYSRQPESSDGCVHAQDRLWHDREEIKALWDQGAKVYVCGSRGLGDGVKSTVVRMLVESGKADEQGASKWYESMRNVRFATDVFD